MEGIIICYLFVDVVGPETGPGPVVGMGREERGCVGPDFVDVLKDDGGLADGSAVVDKDGYLLMNGVHFEEERVLVGEGEGGVLFNGLELHTLLSEGYHHSHRERAAPPPHDGYSFFRH